MPVCDHYLATDYIRDAMRTRSDPAEVLARMTEFQVDAIHIIFGLMTELGEFTDVFKCFIYYNRPADLINAKEELGDMCWYMALACQLLETDFETLWKNNIGKLKARYPEKYTHEAANNRTNLEEERKVLESDGNKENSV